MKKNPWRYYHFTFVYHEWQSYDVRFLGYGVQQAIFSFWTIFCPFTEKSKFWKKSLEIPSAYTCVPQMTSYDLRFLRYKVQWAMDRVFCGLYFALLTPRPPLKTWKIKILIKWKKKKYYRYYHLYHKCINENHTMYGSWYMECDRQNFFSL